MGAAKHIVFDWNGTLLDDAKASLQGFNACLKMLGKADISLEKYQAHYMVPFIKLYEAGGCTTAELEKNEQQIHKTFHAAYDEAVKGTALRDGGKEALQFLRDQKAHVVILSNHMRDDIEYQAKRLGVLDYFDAVLANEKHGVAFKTRGKENRLKDYMATKGLKGGIIIGDSIEEIEIGRDFGLSSIAITGGMCSADRLAAEKPNHLIHSLHELQTLIQDGGFA